MLNLRDIFTTGRTADTAFAGLNYPQTAVPWAQDGLNCSRKMMIMSVATNPAAAETIAVGGKTYTFRVTPTLATEIKIGNLMTNGNFAMGDDGNWISYGHWTIDATGALHVAGPASGVIASFADYRATIGGAVLVTDNAHGLVTSDIVIVAGTTNYNGTYQIVKVDNNTFYIKPQNGWKGTETGTWTTTSYTSTLVQEWFPKPITAHTYTVTFTVSGRTAGTITVSIGGVAGTTRNADGTYAEAIVATGAGYLTFTPSVDFDGKVSAVTVTDPASDLKTLTANAIANRINLDTVTSLCTAYIGLEKVGASTSILVVANSIGVTPTFTADGVKVVAALAFSLTFTEAQLETVAYFKKDITAESDVKPTVLVERNAGTDYNYLY